MASTLRSKALSVGEGQHPPLLSFWKGRVGRWPWKLWIPIVLISVAMAAPLIELLIEAAQVAPDLWMRLLQTRIPTLFLNTMALTGLVTLGALLLGVSLAWIVERTDMPGKRFFKPMLLSPLVVPCYVMAICYVEFFGRNGLLEKLLGIFGLNTQVFSIYGIGGAAFVLILATYPFIYEIARNAIGQLDPRLIDAARCSGAGRFKIGFRIVGPLLIPALSSGIVISGLYAISDFGVVTRMRFDTFVKVIYQQMNGSLTLESSVAIGTVLVVVSFVFLGVQSMAWGRRRFTSEKPTGRKFKPIELGAWKIPAFAFVGGIFLLGLVIPVGILLNWWIGSLVSPQGLGSLWQASTWSLMSNLFNSFSVSAIAAVIAVLLALPVSYAFVRKGDAISKLSSIFAQSGQALPGVLVALGVLLFVLNLVPFAYATIFALIFAYVVRFFSSALQAVRSGLTLIPNHLEEGARLLGDSPLKAFGRVTMPLLKPVIIGGWMLVFLSALRELPATLVLRPLGFDTLPVRIWTASAEGFYAQAAPAALLLVLISIPMLVWLHGERSILTRSEHTHE